MAARLAKRRGGTLSTTVRTLGGKKRSRTASPGAEPAGGGSGHGGLQAAYKQAVQQLVQVAPQAAKGTDGRGLVK